MQGYVDPGRAFELALSVKGRRWRIKSKDGTGLHTAWPQGAPLHIPQREPVFLELAFLVALQPQLAHLWPTLLSLTSPAPPAWGCHILLPTGPQTSRLTPQS